MIDPTRNKISTIFKSKNNNILGFKYNGGTDKVGLPHGQGKKEFIYDEKINYDWEMLKNTNHFDTQEFIYDLGVRIDENANYRNGTKHGKAYMNFRPVDHWEANVVFYCTFVKGVINGYALKQSIDEFEQTGGKATFFNSVGVRDVELEKENWSMGDEKFNKIITEAREYIQSLEDNIKDEQEKLNST